MNSAFGRETSTVKIKKKIRILRKHEWNLRLGGFIFINLTGDLRNLFTLLK